MSDSPKYYKDAEGFCYTATPALAALPHLTAWDGDVDERGYAADTPAAPTLRTRKPRAPRAGDATE